MVTRSKAITRDLVDSRRRAVASMRLRAFTVREIREGLAELQIINPRTGSLWSIGTIQGDLDALEAQWRKDAMADVSHMKSKANARIEEIIRLAFKDKDLTAALAAVRSQRELFGLDAPKQTQLGGIPGGEPIPVQRVPLLDGIDLGKLSKDELDALETTLATLERLRADQGGESAPQSP